MDHPFTAFGKANRRLIFMLVASHLLWGGMVLGLWAAGSALPAVTRWWPAAFIAVQLFAAVQLLLPALLLQPEQRTRSFYLFWGGTLVFSVWASNQFAPSGLWLPLLTVLKSALLLLAGTLTGTVLARFVNRLWEIVPVCVVMTLADFYSWYAGPTAGFAEKIKQYYLAPEGPPPLIDMVLIKLAFPGSAGLIPMFGVSDWIMVVFFAVVASRHGVNDNLAGTRGERLARQGQVGRYLPISLVALFAAVLLAQASGLFIPVLPFIALVMLLWYALHYLLLRRSGGQISP